MIILTIHKGSAGRKERREFSGITEAVEFGQRTGVDYEIFDPITGRVIDWNEVNVREEPEWYYDESECLWKRVQGEGETVERAANDIFSPRMFRQNRKLRRVGA